MTGITNRELGIRPWELYWATLTGLACGLSTYLLYLMGGLL